MYVDKQTLLAKTATISLKPQIPSKNSIRNTNKNKLYNHYETHG